MSDPSLAVCAAVVMGIIAFLFCMAAYLAACVAGELAFRLKLARAENEKLAAELQRMRSR